MTSPLHFIVFGVPRSGTKGLAHSLNLHPQIYCAAERFDRRADHSRLTFPTAMLRANDCDPKKIARIQLELARKRGGAQIFGHKEPRYYLSLEQVSREVPNLKNIWIYRSPYGFIPSWNERERRRNGLWRAGQVGLFGLIELLVCIERCLALEREILVFPYEHGLIKDTLPMVQTLRFIGATPDAEAIAKFAKKQKRRRAILPQRPLLDYEHEVVEALLVQELDQIMETESATPLSALAPQLRDYLGRVTPILPGAIDRAFAACKNKAAAIYGADFLRHNRCDLNGVASLEGSKALARFGRHSVIKRVASLYLNRASLAKRAAPI